jgi:hypothetical protein
LKGAIVSDHTSIRTKPWSITNGALLWMMTVCAASQLLNGAEPKKADKTFPKVVLIIRHGEKPPDEDKSPELSEKGKQRAKALPGLFQSSPDRAHPFPTPDFIFATHNSKKSDRPVETVKHLAKRLKLTINDAFRNKEEDPVKGKGIPELRQEIFGNKKYQGKTILICWHHGTIPELAEQLGAKVSPKKFNHEAFDRVWQITYDENGETTFTDLPQRLLPGDSKK